VRQDVIGNRVAGAEDAEPKGTAEWIDAHCIAEGLGRADEAGEQCQREIEQPG
jgi:hypothetical protein